MAIGALDSALSGLRVAQQQINVISNNVSNVGTPGYSRKIVPQSTIAVNGEAVGVTGESIIRKVDLSLERDFWTQISTVNAFDTKVRYLDRIQQFHGDPALEISIAAEIAELRDVFASLADSPEDGFLQQTTVDQAAIVADKFNDMAGLITDLRNDAENEINVTVQRINDLLIQIADLNGQIGFNTNTGRTTAQLEDLRDIAVNELAQEMEVSFFIRGDGVMVVQTAQGVQLADQRAETLFFQPSNMGPQIYYPDTANGIFVGGDPATNPTAFDISHTGLNGNLGALIELRDDILPQQQAQIDELAHKMALRFDIQGLRLFSDSTGNIPLDTAPVPPPPTPGTPVPYVGFASEIQVNQTIIDDPSLIQQGTVATDIPVQSGSNEVIRRVIEFVFGEIDYQEAVGNIDLRANGTGGVTMQEWLGIFSENQVTGTVDAGIYSDISALIAIGGQVFDPPPAGPPLSDEFEITFDDARLGVPAQTYTLSLTAIDAAFPTGGPIADALDQIIAAINNLAPPPDPAFAVQASRSPFGELIIESRANITIDATTTLNGMGQDGLDLIGLTEGVYQTTDPYVDIQVGNDPLVRVTIEPGDTEVEFMDKIEYDVGTQTGVPGLFADLDAGTGFLSIRPGNDDSNGGPVFGGDINLFGGPFQSDGTGGSGVAAGDTIIEALFGGNDPVSNVLYTTTADFRNANLGANASLSTDIIRPTNILDYSQKMINQQSEFVSLTKARSEDEASFRDLLQRQFLDQSAVNLDEELGNLIVVQTAYAASARVVSAVDELFRDLLNAV